MANTPNYNLYKPSRNDNLPVDQTLADNFTIIDNEIKNRKNETEALGDRIDELIAESGTSGSEVVDSRGGFTVLNDRLNNFDKKVGRTVFVEDFGAVGDGVTDDKTAIQNAIQYAYDNQAAFLVFKEGKTYGVSNQISFNGNPGVNGLNTGLIVIANGSTIKLLQHTTTGGVIGFGRGAWTGERETTEKTGNILWIGGTVDINNITGENGFAVSRAENIKIMNATAMNTDYDDAIQGGRGFTVHPASTNISFDNCHAYKVGDAFHVAVISDTISTINGADNFAITFITQTNQAVITAPGHNFVVGELVYLYNIVGMTQLNPTYTNSENNFTVVAVNGNNITLNVDSTSFTAYTSGGNIARANLLGNRDNGISIENCVAYQCRSAFTGEAENAAYSLSPIYLDVTIDGLAAYNCGRNNGQDGIINGSNATGIKIRGLNIYNDKDHPISDVIRGSLQRGVIEGVIEVDTCTSIINASPITRVNSPGMPQFPYSYQQDMEFDLKIKARVVSNALLISSDRSGSSYDYSWRNRYKLFLYGYETTYPFAIKDQYMTNNRNYIEIFDSYNGRVVQGRADHDFSGFNTSTFPAGNVEFGTKVLKGGANTKPELILNALTGGNNISRISAYLDDVSKGSFDFRHGNNRWYVNITGTDSWQFTTANLLPGGDNTLDIGSSGLRLRTIYAGTGTINTSDERLKQQIKPIDDAVLRAWGKVEYTQFKFNDAVEEKGNGARWHFGVIAQRVKEAFESEGLDPFAYGILCYDEWTTEEGLEAGNRYGIRYDEALALECAYLRSKLN